ncbi:MAG TPA: hypothetical protein VFR63_09525 [Gaiellaceae bacterium]|nr:hypothetical protein [Gaiellaceae bacterium]
MNGARGRRARPAPLQGGARPRGDDPRPAGDRPDPVVEADGGVLCEIDGAPLFATADSAVAAVDALVAEGLLVEEAVNDHDVRKHYSSGPELVRDLAPKARSLPAEAIPLLESLERECVVRERCRLRRLRRVG